MKIAFQSAYARDFRRSARVFAFKITQKRLEFRGGLSSNKKVIWFCFQYMSVPDMCDIMGKRIFSRKQISRAVLAAMASRISPAL